MIYVPISVPSFLILRIHDTYFWIYQDRDHDGVALGEGGQGSCPPLPLVPWSPGAELSSPLNSYSCLGASVTLLCTGDGGQNPGCFSSPEHAPCSPGHGLCLPVLAGLSQGLGTPSSFPFPSLPSALSRTACLALSHFLFRVRACWCPLTRVPLVLETVPERPGLPPPPQPHFLAHSLVHSLTHLLSTQNFETR